MWVFDIPGTKTRGVFSQKPRTRVILGKDEFSFCHKEYDTDDSEDISDDAQDNRTETGPVFSHPASLAMDFLSCMVNVTKCHKSPQKELLYFTGKVRILFLGIFTGETMSGTRTAGKINLALMCLLTNLLYPENRESISTKANKTHTKDCTYAVFSDQDYCQTQCHTLVLLPALILQQPCTFHAVIMYSCTGLLHHMACNFQARTKGPGLKSITKCMKPQHTSQRKSELCL